MINPDRLTVKSAEALNEAVALTRKAGNPLVYDLHLLLALLAQNEGIVVPVLQRVGANVASVRAAAEQEAARYAKHSDASFEWDTATIGGRADREYRTARRVRPPGAPS